MLQKLKVPLRKIITLWLPVFVWCLGIFLLSSRPVLTSSRFYWQDFLIKKLAHIFEYAILSTLIYRALVNGGVKKKNAGIWALIFVVFYGASDEYHQSFVPGRQSTIRDVIIDGFGGGLAILIILRYLPKSSKRIKSFADRLNIVS